MLQTIRARESDGMGSRTVCSELSVSDFELQREQRIAENKARLGESYPTDFTSLRPLMLRA
eukprot:scaffold648792_cov36-Prasinocladus_malaysianus.AAC.1